MAAVCEQVVSDEEGYIHLINTDIPKREDGTHRYSWMCHRNAIFDVAFSGLSHPPCLQPCRRHPRPVPLPPLLPRRHNSCCCPLSAAA